MALPLYLAQTPAEMAGNSPSEAPAYMACHFSPGGQGLSNLPQALPPGAMLILDDSTPMAGHDPQRIVTQLTEILQQFRCESLLLDFQRAAVPEQQALSELLSESLPCPVGISEPYAQGLCCPVFLPPVPPDQLLRDYLAGWQGREIWLEAAPDGIALTLTEAGCTAEPLGDFPEDGLSDHALHCHYSVQTASDGAIFRLWRTRSDLDALLAEAETLGITRAIGLWQELG